MRSTATLERSDSHCDGGAFGKLFPQNLTRTSRSGRFRTAAFSCKVSIVGRCLSLESDASQHSILGNGRFHLKAARDTNIRHAIVKVMPQRAAIGFSSSRTRFCSSFRLRYFRWSCLRY